MRGEYTKDVLRLGDALTIPDQAFGAVTYFAEVQDCQGEEGVLGLLFSGSFDKLPTVLDNLDRPLRHPIFSLYLDETDDYPPDPSQAVQTPRNGTGPAHQGSADAASYRPQTAHSEIVFGGVNRRHYRDCLKWQDAVAADGEGAENYWSFRLQKVRVADQDLSTGAVAIIDSGSTIVIGPPVDISAFAKVNAIECFKFDLAGEAYPVPCYNAEGFDVAATLCSNNIVPLQFITEDGSLYELGAKELFLKVDTGSGEICVVRVVASPYVPGWILGDSFLGRYYAAFNFVDKRIGLAEKIVGNSSSGGSVCAEDWPLDIAYNGGPAPEKVPTPQTPTNPLIAPGTAAQAKIGGTSRPKHGASKSSSLGSVGASIGIPVAVVVAAILMVSVITRRRRRSYQRADRHDSAEDGGGMELPGLL